MAYDRMNPKIQEIVDRLVEYSKITYGKDAYALSTAEAKLLTTALIKLSDAVRFEESATHVGYEYIYETPLEEYVEEEIPKDFVVKPRVNEYSGKPSLTRSHDMAQRYLNGEDMWDIAKAYNVTRERVRQCVAKIRRQSL